VAFSEDIKPFTVGGTPVTDLQVLSATLLVDGDCSGFMVAPDFALTAYHCEAKVGSTVLLKSGGCTVTEIVNAPGAEDDSSSGDFTLMKLDCPSAVSSMVTPFEIPAQDERVSGTAQIAGFGNVDGSGEDFQNLLDVQAQITTDYDAIEKKSAQEIAKWFPGIVKSIQSGMEICMLETSGHIEYHGDSGGPTYMKIGTGLQAISVNSVSLYDDSVTGSEVDMTYGTCGPRLAYYADWIKEQMKARH
jgi:hypothetical protein